MHEIIETIKPEQLIVHAQNWAVMVCSIVVSGIMAFGLWNNKFKGQARKLAIGVFFVAFAALLNRGYWEANRIFLENGYTELTAHMVEVPYYRTGISALFVIGYAMHIEAVLGKRHAYAAYALCLAAFAGSYVFNFM